MARRGQVLDEGAEQIEFLSTAADSGGEMIECRVTVHPGRPAPPLHRHPELEERFQVERGHLGLRIAGSAHEVGLGATVVIPRDTDHTFWNAGSEPLVVVTEIRPALRFEQFAETIHVLIRDGHLVPGARPNLLRLAVIANAYRREWRLAGMPPAVRLMLPLLAWIGRRRGYREWYSDAAEEMSGNERPSAV